MQCSEKNDERLRRTSRRRTNDKVTATGRSIPPATAYAFITIHKISLEEEILRVSLRRIVDGIEAADRRVARGKSEKRRKVLKRMVPWRCERKIYRRNKSKVRGLRLFLPSYERRRRPKPRTKKRVEERRKGPGDEGRKENPGRVDSFLAAVISIFEHNSCVSEPRA